MLRKIQNRWVNSMNKHIRTKIKWIQNELPIKTENKLGNIFQAVFGGTFTYLISLARSPSCNLLCLIFIFSLPVGICAFISD